MKALSIATMIVALLIASAAWSFVNSVWGVVLFILWMVGATALFLAGLKLWEVDQTDQKESNLP